MPDYSGVGYDSNIQTSGPNNIQQYLNNVDPVADYDLGYMLHEEENRINGNSSTGYLNSVNLLPNNLQDFIVALRTYDYAHRTPPSAPPATEVSDIFSSTASPDIVNSLLNFYKSTVFPPSVISLTGISDSQIQDLFESSFNNFLKNFSFTQGVDPYVDIRDQFKLYMQNIVTVTNSAVASTSLVRMTYENYFNAFIDPNINPISATNNLGTAVVDFLQKYLASGSSFMPTQALEDWSKAALSNYMQSLAGTSSTTTSTVGATSSKTLVLNRIFALLAKMIGALQQIAAAQSDRLTIFTQWNLAYTNLQNSVKYIIKDEANNKIASDDADRNDYNSYNATLTEGIKAKNATVTDTSKNLQTSINQSSDSANNQISLATSIIQILSTILSAIYR
jgi:hypothetical protein